MHFGIISPPVSGHIHPMAALGRELMTRGHRVTYLQVRDLEAKIQDEGLDFCAIGERDHPVGSLPRSLAELGRRRGLSALRFTIDAVARTSEMVCQDAPEAVRSRGMDALLVDQMEPAGGAVAEHLGLPFVTICNALAINRDPVAPPPFSPWQFREAAWARLRNAVGYAVSDRLTAPISAVVARHRAAWNLPRLTSPDDSFSSRAQICQMPREFDFPRTALPAYFHYVGPLRGRTVREIAFPWDRLDGRPVIYASLGTLQNSREAVFRCFAEAMRDLDVQLVVSHGGGLTEAQAAALPGAPVVVSYAPQEALLRRAALVLTHAGLNTVLDALSCGVPMVTMPITYEQPSIARRVERAGAGLSLSMSQLAAPRVRALARRVLETPAFRQSAQAMREAIGRAGGTARAADIVERAVASTSPSSAFARAV